MPPTAVQKLAERLRLARPEDSHEQREIYERIRELRSAFDGPLDPHCQRLLEAASMLVAFLARMGSLSGDDVKVIAVRLLDEAARVDAGEAETARSAVPPALIRAFHAEEPEDPAGPLSATDLMGDMMLGQILLQRGQILEEHIHQAMKVQRATSMRIGDIFVKIGACSREQVGDAVSHQASMRRVRDNLRESAPRSPLHIEPPGLGLKLVGEALLGEILVEHNLVTRRQLERALEAQKRSGMRIGEALVQMGATTFDQIEQALYLQGRERRFGKSQAGPNDTARA